MSCSKSSVLYQNRHCYQEDFDEVLFKVTNQNGFSFLKMQKDLFIKPDNIQIDLLMIYFSKLICLNTCPLKVWFLKSLQNLIIFI